MKKVLLFLFFTILLFTAKLSATHIVAGYSHYTHVADSRYEINYTLIRDIFSGGANFDESIVVQVYSFDGLNYVHEANLITALDSVYNFDHGDLSAFEGTELIGHEYGTYSVSYDLFATDKDYFFVYQRCCRSNLFTNVSNPNETGITLVSKITVRAQELQNSSISFDKLPAIIVQVNEEVDSPILINNLDDDILSFQLSPTYVGGGTVGTANNPGDPNDCDGITPQGPCYPPYDQVSYSNSDLNFFTPFDGWDNAGMDGQTGSLVGTPQFVGSQAYGFTIHETRDNEIINSTNFDYIVISMDLILSDENIYESTLKVLGNPSEDKFTIQCEANENYEFEVYNVSGEKVGFKANAKRDILELDIEGLSGVYFLRAANQYHYETIKLIKL